jgi:DNA-directed RNA polymerase alpha subunit
MTEERDWHAEPLELLGLSVRPLRCLTRRGIRTIGQLCCIPTLELLAGQSWGEATLVESRSKLAVFGLRLYDDWAAALIADLELTPRGQSLMRELRVTTAGELLALSTEDLFRWSFRETAVRDVFRALGRRGLRLRDGWPRGPQDWTEQV